MVNTNILVRILFCLIFVFLPLDNMDQWFYDHFFKIRGFRMNPSSIVLIRVNDAKLEKFHSLTQYVGEIPTRDDSTARPVWYHEFYENLLDQILSDGPKLVAFTSFFELVDNPPKAKMPSQKIIFSAYLNEESKLIPPSSRLIAGENYGFNNIFPDSDNILRRSYLVYSSGSSLTLRIYHQLERAPIRRDLLQPLWIDFRGPAGSYPTFEATQIMNDPTFAGVLRDKIVLIGREGSPSRDYETPLGRMSRLESQANIIDTFLSNREIHWLPRYVPRLFSLAAIALSIAVILYYPITVSWFILLFFSVLLLLVCLLSFSELKVWIGISNPLFCVFGTHLLMLGVKLSRHEEKQWKIQQETQYLKEMDEFKNNFISLFSHDLKTPISKIKAITDRLLTDHPDLAADVKEALKSIDRTNGELARSISDILKVTKMESMPLEPAREVVDLNRLVEESIQRLRFLADEKKIALVMDLEPLFSMEADHHLIQEVITNLVENAIKYSPPNRKVVIRTREDENQMVSVSIIDEGEGIPSEEIPRITGKFYRGRKAVLKTKGSGLGLYLAKYFVELHRGDLVIESEVGKGTTVKFRLPIGT